MIYPVLLSGGSGTRLWPLSRKSHPKQFGKLTGERSLFQQTAMRFKGPAFGRPSLVTGADFRFIVTEQLAACAIDHSGVLIEPETKNTAPAILAACLHAVRTDEDAVVLICPCDHKIDDDVTFSETVLKGLDAAQSGSIVTFGITASRPETGYGYLELEEVAESGVLQLKSFKEKPSLEVAQEFVASGRFLWNAGIFMAQAKTLIDAFQRLQPAMFHAVNESLDAATQDLGFVRLDPDAWLKIAGESVDYAIMEHADNLVAVPFSGAWSDLGDWQYMWRESDKDGDAVSTDGAALAINCQNTLLRCEDENMQLVGLGLENIAVVAMKDAVLVTNMDCAQDTKLVVNALKERDVPQAENLNRDFRPWGWYESLVVGGRFQVKRIHVRPGAALSLQGHFHRSEHWIVVQGTAKVTVEDEVKLVPENASVYIPLGAKHRMENPGKLPMVLIEVQTGSYLGEDDIVRYEDRYARGQGARG